MLSSKPNIHKAAKVVTFIASHNIPTIKKPSINTPAMRYERDGTTGFMNYTRDVEQVAHDACVCVSTGSLLLTGSSMMIKCFGHKQ